MLEALPRHVAIIMDGNGRWAKRRLMPRSLGHRAGVERVRTVVRMSSDLGIPALTLYAFSTENWKRPKDEVSTLMGLLVEFLRKELDELHENKVRIQTIGDLSRLPEDVRNEIVGAIQKTKDNTGLILTMALNYGARAEIAAAAKALAREVKTGSLDPEEIDEARFAAKLMTAGLPDPDLVIRTSGEQRISNFLLYQIAYSEFYFTNVYWPDFNEDEYYRALVAYGKRQRRFGAAK